MGKGKNLGGRAYLVAKLGKRGVSRRLAVRILNKVFREMGLAQRRGEYVEFPFGYLKADKRLSQRWEMIGDEPMRLWWVEHVLDEDGERLLEGGKILARKPGWSLKPDRRSLAYLFDRAGKRARKKTRQPARIRTGRKDRQITRTSRRRAAKRVYY